MGSLGVNKDDSIDSGNGNSNVDLSDAETQIFDSQFSPPSSPGAKLNAVDANTSQFLHRTVPLDDTLPMDDAFETQVIDFGGETQVMNLDDETQLLDDLEYGETQILDDLEYVENTGAHLFEKCNAEAMVESDDQGTELLEDTEEFCDDETTKKVDRHPLEQEKIVHNAVWKQVSPRANAKIGSIFRGFTSIRVASIRTSGLAACNIASEGHKSASCSVIGNSQYVNLSASEHNPVQVIEDSSKHKEKVDQEFTIEGFDEKMKNVRNEHKCRIGSSTARKLFSADMDLKEPDDQMNKDCLVADLPPFGTENELAGLSYVDSQEPGDLSPANALDFVDRFLKFNTIEFDQDIDLGKSTGEKSTKGQSQCLSSAKGTQSFVKIANARSLFGGGGIFDWDDNREDEGGGEFFQRKKEIFFHDREQKRRPSAQSRRVKSFNNKDKKTVGEPIHRGKQSIHDDARGLANSDSKLFLRNRKGTEKFTKITETNLRKNLTEELDEQLATGVKDGTVATSTNADIPDMLSIGVDTQMAAEAMETLCFGVGVTDANEGSKDNQNNTSKGEKTDKANSEQDFLEIETYSSNSGFNRGQLNERSSNTNLRKELCKQSKNVKRQTDKGILKAELKQASPDGKQQCGGSVDSNKLVTKIDELHGNGSSGQVLVKKRRSQENHGYFAPVASRTRQSLVARQLKMAASASNGCGEMMSDTIGVDVFKNKGKRSIPNDDLFDLVDANNELIDLASNHSGKVRNLQEKLDMKLITSSSVADISVDYPRGKRTRQTLSHVVQTTDGKITARIKKLRIGAMNPSKDLGVKRTTQPLVCAGPTLSSINSQSEEMQNNVAKFTSGDAFAVSNSVNNNGKALTKDLVVQITEHCDSKSDEENSALVDCRKENAMIKATRGNNYKLSVSACNTPVNCTTPVNESSPICMGDEYLKQSRRKNLCRSHLMKEINCLIETSPVSAIKNSRQRRDIANVRVLFSHHLEEDVIRQQRKILVRLGALETSSVSDATHFVTDKFVRTRNMLEAIALGKPVVTHMWLESCGQASCLIDEKKYILRDTKKEKEFGFSMPVSLARACQHALLQGQRVLITPKTKPGKEILASLVKAVNGLAVERIGRSALKDEKVPDDLLVLSCEEDYALCVPFLEKGAAIYSSELLLNGIVIQKLEYERHRLFVDHVKETRSTTWLRRAGNEYLRVAKHK